MPERLFPDPAPVRDERSCFILMPFRSPFNEIYTDHIFPALGRLRVSARRADDIFSARPVILDIWDGISSAAFLVAELTGRNPNVFYELGIAHTLGKPVILLAQTAEDLPFDIRGVRAIIYEYTPRGCRRLEELLVATVREVMLDLNLFTIGISGSNRSEKNPFHLLGYHLSALLHKMGYRIVSGGGQGVAFEVLKGLAQHASHAEPEQGPSTIRTFKPIGYTDFPPPPIGQVLYQGRTWDECRQVWVGEVDALLVIGGGTGTRYEVDCARTRRIPILVLRGSGGTADEIAGSLGKPPLSSDPLVAVIESSGLESLMDDPTTRLVAETIVRELRELVHVKRGASSPEKAART